MIPLRHETEMRRAPLVTIAIISVCIAVFAYGRAFTEGPGLVPVNFMYGLFHPARALLPEAAALLISFFMHAGILHLCSNLWYLWLFGPAIEERIGALPFVIGYAIFGAVSMLAQVVSSPLSNIPIIGASGAIAGIMGLHCILLPRGKLVCYFPPLFFFRIPVFIFLLIWICIQYINVRYAGPHGPPVAWWAHITGFMCGLMGGCMLLIRNRKLRTGAMKAP